jgi:hypothetical protein
MKFRFVFWDVAPCKIIVDNYFTRQYIPKDKSGRHDILITPIFQIQDIDQSLKPSSILAGYQSELASVLVCPLKNMRKQKIGRFLIL